ncbi:helix-turn-helix domain-containing protein [Nitrospiraceae bacterium AH_259_D15_M11_P09]|nr:helix-turn-helix domain-containing protein [Nitrospiraceae bacterium AH_259_D15_M11_P09]
MLKDTQLLTVAEAAQRLRKQESTLRRMILERRIGYVKIGRSVLIPLEVVETLIATGYRPPITRPKD